MGLSRVRLLTAMTALLTFLAATPSRADDDAPKKKAGKITKGSSTTAPKGMKAKHLNGEATLKGKDSNKVDFEAADIGGERKTPLGTLINQNKADKNYDFVKIRLSWHPEMVQSASALDSGK